MGITDELRGMLDERGVEWIELVGHPVVVGTAWYDRDGCSCAALEHADDVPDGMLSVHVNLTPEQAIAATLGRGTCRVIATKKLGDLFGYRLSCGHSMVNPFDDHPDYCPWCGAKIVDPTTNDADAEVDA